MNLGIRDVIAVGVPYLIAVGACYMFGYWGAFHINVLEFISFADVAKLAIYPLVASLVFFIAGVLVSELVFSPCLPPGGGASSKVGQFGQKHWRWFVAIPICIAVAGAIYGREPWKWLAVAMLLSPLSIPLAHLEKLIEVIPNPHARHTTLYLLLLLPMMSFVHGRLDAFYVKTGASGQFVDVVRSKLPIENDENNRVAYLGYLGNVYVLREAKTGQLVLVKQSDDSPLFLSSKP